MVLFCLWDIFCLVLLGYIVLLFDISCSFAYDRFRVSLFKKFFLYLVQSVSLCQLILYVSYCLFLKADDLWSFVCSLFNLLRDFYTSFQAYLYVVYLNSFCVRTCVPTISSTAAASCFSSATPMPLQHHARSAILWNRSLNHDVRHFLLCQESVLLLLPQRILTIVSRCRRLVRKIILIR